MSRRSEKVREREAALLAAPEIKKLLDEARYCQNSIEDWPKEWRDSHGGHYPADLVRRAQPTIKRFDAALEAFRDRLKRDFDDAPFAVDLGGLEQFAPIVEVLNRVAAAVRKEYKPGGGLADPGPGQRGAKALPWRKDLRAELMAKGFTKRTARAITTEEALRTK